MTLTLDQVILHTVVHHSSTSTWIPNFIEIEETFCGRTNVQTDGHLRLTLLGRLRRVNLKISQHLPTLGASLTSYATHYMPSTGSRWYGMSSTLAKVDIPQHEVHFVDAQEEPVSERWRYSKPSRHHPPYSCYSSPVTPAMSSRITDSYNPSITLLQPWTYPKQLAFTS